MKCEKYWKLLEFFSTRKNSELRSVLYPRLVAEISFTIKDLKDVTTSSPSNSPIWPLKKTDRSWRMQIYCQKPNLPYQMWCSSFTHLLVHCIYSYLYSIFFLSTCPEEPPEAICLQVARPTIYLYCFASRLH